jgi:hypothetical protein
MHNILRKDRYTETAYLDEKKQLFIKDNGSYTLDSEDAKPLMATKWQPNGNQWLPQSSEDKSSEDKSNEDEEREGDLKTPFELFVKKYKINCDNYSAVISEIDFDLLDKAFSESKWLQTNMTCLSVICKQYNKIVGGAFKDFNKTKVDEAWDMMKKLYEEAKAQEEGGIE